MSFKKLFGLILVGATLLGGCALPAVPTELPSPTSPFPAATATLPAAATQAPTEAPTQTLPPVITATPPAATAAPTTAPTVAPTAVALIPGQIKPFTAGSDVILTQVHMTSKTEGWAVGNDVKLDPNDQHVLHTANGSATWQDVTPPQKAGTASTESGPGTQAQAFFLNAQQAWVGFSPQAGSTGADNRVIWYTGDGGQSWKTSATLAQSPNGNPDYFAPGPITFLADGKTGWLMVHAGAGMNHDYIYIFGTTDGGANWKMLVDPMDINKGSIMGCYKSGMGFVDATHGWLAGSCNGVAAGVLLFETKNGGSNWSAVTLPAPAQAPTVYTAQDFACGSFPPVFFSAKDGLLQVTCQQFDQSKTAYTWLYVTADGGASWKARPAPASTGTYQFLNEAQGWFAGDGHVYSTADGGKTWLTLTKVDWTAQLSFVDAKTGWVVATAGEVPNLAYALVSSVDGGVHWALIKPKVGQ
jgi:photosystem II stability/assembly factor-like uncharacterized protein